MKNEISWKFPHSSGYKPDVAKFARVLSGDVEALWDAFGWNATEQGHAYWRARVPGIDNESTPLSQFDREQLAVWMGLIP